MSFIAELRRRNVLRVGAAYLAVAWLLIQVAQTLLPAFGVGGAALRIVIVVLAIGLVPLLVFAWAFELTPEGLKRESEVDRSQSITPQTGKKLDRLIMVILALALGYFAVDKFVLAPPREQAATEAARAEGRTESVVKSYGEKSIAVLPFIDMSAKKDQEYFSDGISEELLNLLAKIPELRVISRSSAFSYKGKDVKLAQVAQELNVAHILEGSVRKAGNKVRITAQLIDARSDTHLWSETYDRPLDDIFAVQDEIAAMVVAQLKVKLGGTPKAKSTDPGAYALYLQGRQANRQNTAEGYGQSIALYKQALAIDPSYDAAWVGLSGTYATQAAKGLRPIDEGYRLAREAANRALAIDPDCTLAYVALSRIANDHDNDLAAAARHLERALALEPSNPDVIRGAANLANDLGRPEEAVSLDEYAVARDPLTPAGHGALAFDYGRIGRLDEAIASYRTALTLSPGRIGTQYNISELLLRKGEPAAALEAVLNEADESWRRVGLPMAYHSLGRQSDSDSALADLIAHDANEWAYNIAYVFAWRGEADRAFQWLDKAVAYRDPGLVEIISEPLFASIQHDPRWLPFLRRIGRAPEQLAAIRFDVKLPQS
jgi:adenylate cyclase